MADASRHFRRVFGWLVMPIAVASCTGLGHEPSATEPSAARVYDAVLSMGEIQNHIPDGTGEQDSITMASRYIDQWIREQVVVHQAELRLTASELNFDQELEAYRHALLLHAYKDRFVNERLSTEVSEAESLEYYKRNNESFILTDYGVRVLFVNAPVAMDEQMDEIRNAMATLDSSQFLFMERWCVENGAVFSLADDLWWTLSDLTKEVPLELYRAKNQIARRRPIEFEADGRIYVVRFLDHALKNEVAPFEAVREAVDELILHQRRQSLLIELEENLVVAAWAEGAVQRTKKGAALRPAPSP